MFIDSAVFAIVLFAVMAWGGNRPFFYGIFSFCLLLTLAVDLSRRLLKGLVVIHYSPVFLPLIAFLILVALQCLHPLVALDAASTWWLPYTMEPHTTRTWLLLVAGYATLCFLVVNGLATRKRISLALFGIMGLGVLESLYGLIQQIGGYEFVWTVPTRHTGAQGTLMNHNHFAFLLNITLCAGAGIFYRRAKELLRGQRFSLRFFLGMPDVYRLFGILLFIALIGLGVLLSLSRTGIFAMFIALLFMWAALCLVERKKSSAILGAAVLLAIIGFGIYAGMDAALDRYANLARNWQAEASRLRLWKDAWPLAAKAPIFGIGLGSFRWIYPAYETLDSDIPAIYAHSDYLQLLIETGVIGFFLVAWAFVLCWKSAMKNLKASDLLTRSIGLCALGTLVVAAVQEVTDYSLYIPGVAATLILVLSINERTCMLSDKTAEELPDPEESPPT